MAKAQADIKFHIEVKTGSDVTNQCCHRVSSHQGNWIHYYRCSRKAKEQIFGYGFCASHARNIRRIFEIEIGERKTRYLGGLSYGIPYLVEFYYIEETEKSYMVVGSKPLRGHKHVDQRFSKQEQSFETFQGAVENLKQAVLRTIQSLEDKLEENKKLLEEITDAQDSWTDTPSS